MYFVSFFFFNFVLISLFWLMKNYSKKFWISNLKKLLIPHSVSPKRKELFPSEKSQSSLQDTFCLRTLKKLWRRYLLPFKLKELPLFLLKYFNFISDWLFLEHEAFEVYEWVSLPFLIFLFFIPLSSLLASFFEFQISSNLVQVEQNLRKFFNIKF